MLIYPTAHAAKSQRHQARVRNLSGACQTALKLHPSFVLKSPSDPTVQPATNDVIEREGAVREACGYPRAAERSERGRPRNEQRHSSSEATEQTPKPRESSVGANRGSKPEAARLNTQSSARRDGASPRARNRPPSPWRSDNHGDAGLSRRTRAEPTAHSLGVAAPRPLGSRSEPLVLAARALSCAR